LEKELNLSQYKYIELEKICASLKQDVGHIGKLSDEIDRLTNII
jgi:hypothetical protein